MRISRTQVQGGSGAAEDPRVALQMAVPSLCLLPVDRNHLSLSSSQKRTGPILGAPLRDLIPSHSATSYHHRLRVRAPAMDLG